MALEAENPRRMSPARTALFRVMTFAVWPPTVVRPDDYSASRQHAFRAVIDGPRPRLPTHPDATTT